MCQTVGFDVHVCSRNESTFLGDLINERLRNFGHTNASKHARDWFRSIFLKQQLDWCSTIFKSRGASGCTANPKVVVRLTDVT